MQPLAGVHYHHTTVMLIYIFPTHDPLQNYTLILLGGSQSFYIQSMVSVYFITVFSWIIWLLLHLIIVSSSAILDWANAFYSIYKKKKKKTHIQYVPSAVRWLMHCWRGEDADCSAGQGWVVHLYLGGLGRFRYKELSTAGLTWRCVPACLSVNPTVRAGTVVSTHRQWQLQMHQELPGALRWVDPPPPPDHHLPDRRLKPGRGDSS